MINLERLTYLAEYLFFIYRDGMSWHCWSGIRNSNANFYFIARTW